VGHSVQGKLVSMVQLVKETKADYYQHNVRHETKGFPNKVHEPCTSTVYKCNRRSYCNFLTEYFNIE